MENKKTKLCLIGFGNAAKAFCNLLNKKSDDIRKTYGQNIIVTAIATKSKGNLINTEGIDLNKLLATVEEHGVLDTDTQNTRAISSLEIIERSNADILIELSTLSIKDGQPAISHIEKAFQLGMHVITANKGPIAWDFDRLKTIAEDKGKVFLYETTVMDGTPVFNLVRETLPGCKVIAFKGILNTTTNFILEEMESGASYQTAVSEAQRRGFAEADPSLDVDGWDAAAKTAVLANVLMGKRLSPLEIDRKGIRELSINDIQEAQKQNKKIKLVCEGILENGNARGKVHPVMLDKTDIFSNIASTSSILSITTDLMGEICIVEKNPEIEQTAYGIYSDLLTFLKKLNNGQ